MPQSMIREAVCVFENQQQLDAAINELESTAFPRHDISVLASDKKLEETFGTSNIKMRNLEDSPEAPRDISVRPEEKTILGAAFTGVCAYIAGCIAGVMAKDAATLAFLASIAGGSVLGAVIGGVVVYFVIQNLYQDSQHKIRKGGLVLWVRTPAPDQERTAKTIMRKHGGHNVHIHSVS
ncbi:MAG TPA: hypothetical protein PLO23_00870 [Alphaproteobacteria bacterium]|nr:hypothetical protein [Alphaproteobacteria bacterium]